MDIYLWIKALHVISVISWMAGLLYLPRLFVYHCAQPVGSPASETFKVMERRLLRFIMNPAMVTSFVFGIWLIVEMGAGAWSQGWLHAKIALVLVLAAMHGMMAKWRRDFAADRNRRSARYYRLMNEVPTVLMIGIVVLAVVRPF
ncbi:MAG: protoporphyrinogen oxidase HemJ [Rhodospirillales bacterium]|nr:protoporphyrinogen oxidase HemJ [Rhodospirillales bacterium]